MTYDIEIIYGTSCYKDKSVVVRFSTYSFNMYEINFFRNKLLNVGFTTFVYVSKMDQLFL